MKMIVVIISMIIMICDLVPQSVYAQAKATAVVTATVIPSISIELMKTNTVLTKENTSTFTMNLRGTENVLITVNSKEEKSVNIFQLTIEKSTMVNIPSSMQANKTSITYLSS